MHIIYDSKYQIYAGGYFVGEIKLVNAPRQCFIEITLAPSDEYSGVSIVPHMLHLTWKTGRRGDPNEAGEEPVKAHEWRLVLFRDGGKIYR